MCFSKKCITTSGNKNNKNHLREGKGKRKILRTSFELCKSIKLSRVMQSVSENRAMLAVKAAHGENKTSKKRLVFSRGT